MTGKRIDPEEDRSFENAAEGPFSFSRPPPQKRIHAEQFQLTVLGFRSAIRCGDLGLVEKLLTLHPTLIRCADVFELACAHGREHIVFLLITRGLELAECGFSGMRVAAINGHHDVVQMLFHQGVAIPNESGETLIDSITSLGHMDVLIVLMKYGLSLNEPQWRYALYWIGQSGNLHLLHCVLRHHAEMVNRSDIVTIFRQACSHGHISIVEYLLTPRRIPTIDQNKQNICADLVHDEDDQGLRLACAHGRWPIVEMLITRFGANVHAANNEPLIVACMNGSLETVRFLQSRKANPLAQNGMALIMASRYDHEQIVGLLLTTTLLGSNSSVVDIALGIASSNGCLNVVKRLLQHHPSEDGIDNALIQAATARQPKIVACLLDSGADVYCQSNAIQRCLNNSNNLGEVIHPNFRLRTEETIRASSRP